ncbi:hypothetical protein Y032_0077g1137 [Ancylostoma ceylanicum]|uniref:Uncharacterized protein n=1 Tax=Ancylostoma ceylanicum TaxID=53326 RepID=A0A016TUI8_9BILA|nr:hypothetical protein Y032_0077g1137 [Ancylostoma ceylanicum]
MPHSWLIANELGKPSSTQKFQEAFLVFCSNDFRRSTPRSTAAATTAYSAHLYDLCATNDTGYAHYFIRMAG